MVEKEVLLIIHFDLGLNRARLRYKATFCNPEAFWLKKQSFMHLQRTSQPQSLILITLVLLLLSMPSYSFLYLLMISFTSYPYLFQQVIFQNLVPQACLSESHLLLFQQTLIKHSLWGKLVRWLRAWDLWPNCLGSNSGFSFHLNKHWTSLCLSFLLS